MPFFMRNAAILAKTETTYADDALPVGANALLVRNLTMTPQQAEFASRDVIRPYYGNSEQLPTAISTQCEFEIELAGSGTVGTPPAWGPLLCACGFAETVTTGAKVTYTPVSTDFESMTLVYSLGGSTTTRVLHKLRGARGTVSIEIKSKAIPVMKFRMQGLYDAVRDDTTALNPDFSLFQTPQPGNAANTPAFTLHSASSPLSDLTIDLANSLVFRSLIGGVESIELTDRKAGGSAIFEATSVAKKDWWTIAKEATLGELNLTHGTRAGNIVELVSPRVQVNNPQYQDQQGVAMLQVGLSFVPTSVGNDELSIIVR